MTSTITKMPLSELFESFSPAYGDSWEEAWSNLESYASDMEVVNILKAHLDSGNDFDEPILLDREEMSIINGMHRLYASKLAGRSTVSVHDGFLPETDVPWFEVEFTADELVGLSADEQFNLVMDTLRSFDGPRGWLNCDVISGVHDIFHAAWEWPADELALLEKTLVERARVKGWEMKIKSITFFDFDED